MGDGADNTKVVEGDESSSTNVPHIKSVCEVTNGMNGHYTNMMEDTCFVEVDFVGVCNQPKTLSLVRDLA